VTPEARARADIDRLLTAAGWHLCDCRSANIHAARGVAIREFELAAGHGTADYLLYVDGKAAGVVEAKKHGATLTGVERQSARYTKGLPTALPAWSRPLPFAYGSTGLETRFTSGLDPEPRSRAAFAFHRPETLPDWLDVRAAGVNDAPAPSAPGRTMLARLQHRPPLITQWGDFKLWPAQIQAILNLEASLAQNKPRALIQMATGSGKTFTAISFIYRLIKFAGARRVLFLVDRGNLGRKTRKEFDQYVSPVNNYKFGEEYIVQHLTSNQLDRTARVCICTIQRMYSMLKGRELPDEADEESTERVESLFKEPEPLDYNPNHPIEDFDIIVTDKAHRSIYNLWRHVLHYLDAYLIGLTATPPKHIFGFFNDNLMMEYGHPQAVADGVNFKDDVYRVNTAAQLRVHHRPVRQWHRRRDDLARIEPRDERVVVELRRQRPREARRTRALERLLHGGTRGADRRCDVAIARPGLVLEAQDLPDLAHGQPRLRHRRPPRETLPRTTVARLSRSTSAGPAHRGTVARHAVETAAGMAWNPQQSTKVAP
jgi:type I restriction enzyme R subunit